MVNKKNISEYIYENEAVSFEELQKILVNGKGYFMECPETEMGENYYEDFNELMEDINCYTREGWTMYIKGENYENRTKKHNNIVNLFEDFEEEFGFQATEDLLAELHERFY